MSAFPQQEAGHNPEYTKQAHNSPMYAKQLRHKY